jgi:hypothetical protein
MHGLGTFVFANGNRYEGDFKDDTKSGFGTLHYANGEEYSGGWLNDMAHGKGELKYAQGDRYDGSWSEGQKHGEGGHGKVHAKSAVFAACADCCWPSFHSQEHCTIRTVIPSREM